MVQLTENSNFPFWIGVSRGGLGAGGPLLRRGSDGRHDGHRGRGMGDLRSVAQDELQGAVTGASLISAMLRQSVSTKLKPGAVFWGVDVEKTIGLGLPTTTSFLWKSQMYLMNRNSDSGISEGGNTRRIRSHSTNCPLAARIASTGALHKGVANQMNSGPVVYYLLRTPTAPEAKPVAGDYTPGNGAVKIVRLGAKASE